jgi:hypothetical protein
MSSKTAKDFSELNSSESGIVAHNVAATENLRGWADLFRYQIKAGFAFVLDPSSKFSLKALKLEEPIGQALAAITGGTAFSDETAAANSAGAGDVSLTSVAGAKNDAYYFRHWRPFSALAINTSQVAKAATIVWEYYNGSTWATVPGLVDGTVGFTVLTKELVTFTPPVDWAKDTPTPGTPMYSIRARESAAGGGGYQQALGTQVWINSSEAMGATDKVRVVLMDTSEEVRIPLLQPINYAQVTEMQDPNLMAHLDITKPVLAQTGLWLVVQVISGAGVIDSTTSYFKLTTLKYHPVLSNQR